MPSPFPGMDPYLEGPEWTSFHAALAAEIVRQLAPKLRPRYRALPEKRWVLEIRDGDSAIFTDLYPDGSVAPSEIADSVGAAAPLRLRTEMPSPVPQVTVEIRSLPGGELVTAIEILSPANKRGAGRREYLERRQRLLLSATHLVELDLLRRGERLPMREPPPEAPWYAFVSRAGERPLVDVWPIALDDPLPELPIPLLPGDADVALDLQEAFEQVYDLLAFDLAVDYEHPPPVPWTAAELPRGPGDPPLGGLSDCDC